MTVKTLTILRGLSGSGKSRVAKEMAKKTDAVVISTDDFWYDKDGNYNFDYSRIGEAHDDARKRAWELAEAGTPHIIIDNTNARWWEMFPYLELAKEFKYEIEVCMVGGLSKEDIALYAARNIHNVPVDIIQRQAKNFERLMNPEMGHFLESMRRDIEYKLKNG